MDDAPSLVPDAIADQRGHERAPLLAQRRRDEEVGAEGVVDLHRVLADRVADRAPRIQAQRETCAQARAQRLGQREDVGDNAVALEGVRNVRKVLSGAMYRGGGPGGQVPRRDRSKQVCLSNRIF